MPERKTKAEMAAFRRLDLIEATMEVIAADGHVDASVERITAKAGVSRGLIRHYFNSKGELLAEVYRHIGEQLNNEVARVSASRPPDGILQLSALVDVIFDPPIFQLNVLSAWYALRDAARTDDVLRKANREVYSWYKTHVRKLFHATAPKGKSKLEIDRIADGFVALTDGLWLELTIEPYAFRSSYAKQICRDYVVHALKLEESDFLLPSGTKNTQKN